MSARAPRTSRLPSSDELFRPTGVESPDRTSSPPVTGVAGVAPLTPGIRAVDPADASPAEDPAGERRPSGRERHDEKITVYVSADELLDLEQARITLKRDHGLKVDRGRIVRAALADALSDLEASGGSGGVARLVSRLRDT